MGRNATLIISFNNFCCKSCIIIIIIMTLLLYQQKVFIIVQLATNSITLYGTKYITRRIIIKKKYRVEEKRGNYLFKVIKIIF